MDNPIWNWLERFRNQALAENTAIVEALPYKMVDLINREQALGYVKALKDAAERLQCIKTMITKRLAEDERR